MEWRGDHPDERKKVQTRRGKVQAKKLEKVQKKLQIQKGTFYSESNNLANFHVWDPLALFLPSSDPKKLHVSVQKVCHKKCSGGF